MVQKHFESLELETLGKTFNSAYLYVDGLPQPNPRNHIPRHDLNSSFHNTNLIEKQQQQQMAIYHSVTNSRKA